MLEDERRLVPAIFRGEIWQEGVGDLHKAPARGDRFTAFLGGVYANLGTVPCTHRAGIGEGALLILAGSPRNVHAGRHHGRKVVQALAPARDACGERRCRRDRTCSL